MTRVPRLHIELPENLHRRAKIAAATRGVTLKAFVIEALERQVDEQAEDPVQRAKEEADVLVRAVRTIVTELGHDPSDPEVNALVVRVLRNVGT